MLAEFLEQLCAAVSRLMERLKPLPTTSQDTLQKLGLSFTGQLSYVEMLRNVHQAEQIGFQSIWVAEHYFYHDALSTISALSPQFNRLLFGTGIVSPYTRHPGLLAMSAQTVSEISEGRFVLGIGTNSRFWKVLGIEDKTPLKTIRNSVEMLRRLLNGEVISEGGKVLEQEMLKLGTSSKYYVPIYIGAIGPKMLRLAADIADGVILSAGSSPEHCKAGAKVMSESSHIQEIHRNGNNAEVACYIIACSDNDAKTRLRAKERLANLLSLEGREELLGSMSKDERIPIIRAALRSDGTAAAARLIGDDMLDHVCVSGSRDQCVEKVQEYRRAGVTLPILSPVGGNNFEHLLNAFAT
ncbi:MAG: LLM class flavin-dependent oxidoreductase [Nitrososphaerota archaeon]|nr:LLM class flavin-dependent oxidoreductase [Nitrososphaerota archaeon]